MKRFLISFCLAIAFVFAISLAATQNNSYSADSGMHTYRVVLRCTTEGISGTSALKIVTFTVKAKNQMRALEAAQLQAKQRKYKCGTNPDSITQVN